MRDKQGKKKKKNKKKNNYTQEEASLMDDLITRLGDFFKTDLHFEHGKLAKKNS